jgi:factor associated with neutral sphingomyelinase activation
MLGTNDKKSRKRFTKLFLEERDYYFEDYEGKLLLPPNGQEPVPYSDRLQLSGRIHLSSKNVSFEPDNERHALYRLSLRNLYALRPRGSGTNQLLLTCSKYAMITPNQPFTFVSLPNNQVGALQGEFGLTLSNTPLDTFVTFLEQLHELELMRDSALAARRLEEMVARRESETRFDFSRIEDLHERVRFPDGQPVLCSQITPLVSTAGCLLLTDQRLYFQPFNNVHSNPVQKFALSSCERVYKRRYCMADVGLEVFLTSYSGSAHTGADALQESVYFAFKTKQAREMVHTALLGCAAFRQAEQPTLAHMLCEWSAGRVSNMQYLLFLNQLAARSFQDLTQYPVFPWVLCDFTSPVLNLGDPHVYRDLSKPVGALNPTRLQYFQQRRADIPDDSKKFLYGTHYSTPGYVLYYLVRCAPQYQLRLQNGRFDHPDRQFLSIARAWDSCLHSNTDVKELIPEFYHTGKGCGDFLLNELGLPLGMRADGEEVDHVALPPWASSPVDFVTKMRAALESPHVSATLHHWINLVFGVLSTGKAALENNNEFYWLTYEGAVDLDSVSDPMERQGLELQIREFGQTPRQVLFAPHPRRGSPLSMEQLQAICSPFAASAELKGGAASAGKLSSPAVAPAARGRQAEDERPGQKERERVEKEPTKGPALSLAPPSNPSLPPALSRERSQAGATVIQARVSPSKQAPDREGATDKQPESSFTLALLDLAPPVVNFKGAFDLDAALDLKQLQASADALSLGALARGASGATDGLKDKAGDGLPAGSRSGLPAKSVWLSRSLQSKGVVNAHRDQVTGLCLSSDGASLYSVGQDSSLRVYNVLEKKLTRAAKIGELALAAVRAPEAGPAAERVVVASWDNCVHLYSLRYGSVLSKLSAHEDTVSTLDVWRDTMVTGSWDNSVKLWQLTNAGFSSCVHEFTEHESEVKIVSLSSQGTTCVSGADDGGIILWDLRQQTHAWRRNVFSDSDVCAAQFAMDGKQLLACCSDGLIKHLDCGSGRVISTINAREKLSCLYTDGSAVICGCREGSVRMWDLLSGAQTGNVGVACGNVSCLAVGGSGANCTLAVGASSNRNNIELFGLGS